MNLHTEISKRDALYKAWKGLTKRPFSYGFDNVTVEKFREGLDGHLEEIQKQLSRSKYDFYPLKLYLLKKKEGGYRPIKIPSVRDRVLQKAIADTVYPHLNKKYHLDNESSFAYIPGRRLEDAAKKVLEYRKLGYRYVCKADIKKFFENVDKDLLMKMINEALPDNSINYLIESAIKNDIDIKDHIYFERTTGKAYKYDLIAGIAQGSPLSPMFANLYLHAFDQYAIDQGFIMIRYADDILFLCKNLKDAEVQYRKADQFLKSIKLELYPLRSDIPGELWEKDGKYSFVRSMENLEFLGLRFSSGKVFPANSSYKNVMKEIRGVAYGQSISLTRKLNSINSRVVGWCSAYSYTTEEGARLAALDVTLEDVLTRMLNKHGLKKTNNKSIIDIFGFSTFSHVSSKIREKQNKKSRTSTKVE